MNVKQSLYKNKDNLYFSKIRKEILELLPRKCENVLDLGCGNGATLAWIKEQGICKNTYGIDISQQFFSDKINLDNFLHKDLEECETFFDNLKFDLILILDVLEHLVDPDAFIKKVIKSLKKDGTIILCIPNVRHYLTFKNIFIYGDFPYSNHGLFDKTHLRFYTKKSIIRFLKSHNLSVKKILDYPTSFPSKRKIFNYITFGIFSEFLAQQYLMQINLNN